MSKESPPTADLETSGDVAAARRPSPGLVVFFSAGKPACVALPLSHGRIELGRESLGREGVDDDAMSRAHALVVHDGRRWTVRDLGSRNGSFVDGVRVSERVCDAPPIVRVGRTVLLAADDVRDFEVERGSDGAISGPTLRAAFEEIGRAARFGSNVHLSGESGSGKELAARHFHASGPRASGPFVAVNCAAVPHGIAERLLFGAVRGAYSGADSNVDGYVQTAHCGTLFLDEVAELDLAIQAKLLRVLETREVLALGASRPRSVDFGLCSATLADLRAATAKGTFREDLYFRIGRPSVRIPPLRERREEIPWHIAHAVARVAPTLGIDAAFVEACMQRCWPGNVRELTAEAAVAAQRALGASKHSVGIGELSQEAGQPLAEEANAPTQKEAPERATIEAALRAHRGNVTAAARALDMHHNQLRRWLDREGVDPRSFSSDDEGGAADR